MVDICPTLGFRFSSDISWAGQPYINTSVPVTAILRSNPSGTDPGAGNQFGRRPGKVRFRWFPLGWTGDYCRCKDLTVAAGENNPIDARDRSTGQKEIEPNGSLPADIDWIPDVATVGYGSPRGAILAQAIGLSDPPCCASDSVPTDCSSAPANQLSGVFKVLDSARPVTSLFSQSDTHTLAHVAFVIPNTSQKGRRLKIAVSSVIGDRISAARPVGAGLAVNPEVRIGLGKQSLTLCRDAPFSFAANFFAGIITSHQYQEALDTYATPTERFDLDAQAVRQGLIQVKLPPSHIPSYCLLEVQYISVSSDGGDSQITERFTVPVATDGSDR